MATIDDLNTSISELSDQDATDLIYKIRSDRRIKKIVKKTTKKKKTSTKKKTITIHDLSDAQRAALILDLEEML